MVSRVLAVMTAGVLAVQLATFVLLQFSPLPGPPVFSVAQVAAALRSGSASKDEFRFSEAAGAKENQRGRAIRLSAALATELGVPPSSVSLAFVDPPTLGFGPPRRDHRDPLIANRDSMLVGDFTAALRQPNGRWLLVQPVQSGMNAWRLRIFLLLLVALITVAPFAWLLARWVTRPLAVFADAAERIGRDPRTPALPVSGPTEIAHAATAMNEMQQRLNRYIDDRTVMIGAIAHDLRTPLMRMALRLDRAPDDLRQGVERDVAEMQAMIGAATNYVRGATMAGVRRRLDLRSLAESVVDDFIDRGEPVIMTPGDDVIIEGDPIALKSVVDNLVANAVRYAGDASVVVRRDALHAVLEVIDNGPGVSPDDINRLFEPFFRGERSRNRNTGGLGLGLASVRGVAHLHGGEATVSNRANGGLIVRVALPL